MKLSVIIVNYNVKYFLEQAILSALKALENISHEIIVIDNHSTDGSVEFLSQRFPSIKIIENQTNTGFSVANNQGIQLAQGEFILLLNPDTVVQEDTFEKCITFMDAHKDAGALGVKMIDGKGNFLPESKRAFPSPQVAFFKAFGLAALFPKSKIFGKYHLGYLHENQTHEVEVLAGAFMLIRKTVLDKTGLLDETFFMYGEDIDLSYRIVQAGYKNYYFADTEIIHYKGESTKKGSLNYVKMFYNAMKIFARKHFTGAYAGLFITLLNIAIYVRAFLAILARIFKRIRSPLIDAILIFIGMFFIKEYWEYYVRYIEGGQYPAKYLYINVPVYIFIWLLCIYFSGGYDKKTNAIKIVRGIFWGTLVISALYGFFPESFRFSRGMIIAGAGWTVFILLCERFFMHFLKNKNFRFGEDHEKRIIIFGNTEEATRVEQLLQKMHLSKLLTGTITKEQKTADNILGNAGQLEQLIAVHACNELIFCARDISYKEIIADMLLLGNTLNYKIVNSGSESIIGSNSKDSAGDLYSMDIEFAIAKPASRRNKRLFDVLFALFLFCSFPIQFLFVKNKPGLLRNIFLVLLNKKTWVGYDITEHSQVNLPALKPSVVSVLQKYSAARLDENTRLRVNTNYARSYTVGYDMHTLANNYHLLGL